MELRRVRVARAIALTVLCSMFVAGRAWAATTVIQRISTIGCGPNGIGVNPVTNKIYVAVAPAGYVARIDGNTNSIILPNIPVATLLNDVAVNSVTNRIYVAESGTPGNVHIIDGATDTVVATLVVGNNPRWIGVNPVTDTTYVANSSSNSITIVNGLVLGATFAVGGSPGGVGVHTGTGNIYVGVGAPVNGVEVRTAAGVLITTIPGINSPNAVVVDSVANRAYAASQTANTLTIIDTTLNTIVSTAAVGANPNGVAVNPTRNRAYTRNGASSVSVVNTTAGVIEEPDVPIELSPGDIDYNPANDLIYAANNSSCTLSVLRDVGGVCQDSASSHWWNSAWGRRRPLTLNNGAQAETFSDFPVLIKLNASRINYGLTQGLGQDLHFVDSDDVTPLDYEIESWNPAGTSYVWVRVPSVPGTSLKSIFMYFNNPGAADAQNKIAVWNSGYKMVHHLKETAGVHLDSTSNANNSTAINVAAQGTATGQIDGADNFLGGTQNIDVGNSASLNVTAAESLTVEAWIRTGIGDRVVVSKEDPAAGEYQLWVDGFNNAAFWTSDGTNVARANGATVVNDNQFHYLVGTFDRGSGTAQIFVDGVSVGSATNPAVGAIGSPRVLRIGEEADMDPEGGFNFNGIIDEVRVSKVLRSGDWIRAQNLSMTDRYLTFGAETGTCNLRSIGTRPNYGTATVTATTNSRTVTGAGTTWRTSNRGRGDSINIAGFVSTVLSVDSETQLTLVHPYTGATGAGKAYSIARKFLTPRAWEDCIDGGLTACGPDPMVPSTSLVADNRGEIGIVYNDGAYTPIAGQAIVAFVGSTTDALHDITLTADDGNRHYGRLLNGVVFDDGANTNHSVLIQDQFVTVEWLEIKGGDLNEDGVQAPNGLVVPNKLAVKNCLIHNAGRDGIRISDADTNMDVYNNFIFRNGGRGIDINASLTAATALRIFNNTVFGNSNPGISSGALTSPTVDLRNNISHTNTLPDYGVTPAGIKATSRNNLASDTTGTTHSPAGGGLNSVGLTGGGGINFFTTFPNLENLHILPLSAASNTGADLSVFLPRDIDNVIRLTPWEIGADDISQTTAVTLVSFEARGGSGPTTAVELSWETASEIDNLGFHLYRSLSASGPWVRITSVLIPGLGGSPTGKSYGFVDTGVQAGIRYFYELEDVETTGRTERHGPVSAVAGASGPPSGGGGGGEASPGGTLYGSAGDPTLRIVERGRDFVVLELLTPGFRAIPAEGETVRLVVPGFEAADDPAAPAVPVKGAMVEALAGRRVRVASAVASDVLNVPGLRLALTGSPAVVVSPEGEVKAGRAPLRLGKARRGGGGYPPPWARVERVAFQAEIKKARVELVPLRHDPQTGATVLARRLTVRVEFFGTEAGERTLGGARGRRARLRSRIQGVVAQLVTREAGLYRVRFEEVFGPNGQAVPLSGLRLSRQGETVAFHVEPEGTPFGPGSSLFFVGGGELNPDGAAVYELEVGAKGARMTVVPGAPTGPAATAYEVTRVFEENRYYQAGLLDAPDLWQWDILVAPQSKGYAFTATDVAASPRASRVRVVLQGASDFDADPDHHVRVFLNGTAVGEASWDGKKERVIEGEAPPGVLQEGTNTLAVENVGDTAASVSMVFLNRYEVSYPRRMVAEAGRLEGRFPEAGVAEVAGLASPTFVVDTTGPSAWLQESQAGPDGLRFRAESGRRYLAVAQASVLSPEVRWLASSTLRRGRQVDWLLVAPREFLATAQPLVDLRQSQGLRTMAVAIEDVYEEFGHGEAGPEALKAFLEYAYQSWPRPSLRYVLLLGDSTYDPKDYLKTHVVDRVPFYPVKTSYLWTASDPAYAAVNGDDLLPDLAVGRLPAANLEEARVLVEKVVAFESAGRTLAGPAVLVADNGDLGGAFEADADDVAATVLARRPVEKLYLRDLGAGTRAAIVDAFNSGPALLSYVGHGGTVVWASENIFNYQDVASLSAQSQQPLLLTLNCLNGFFHFPPLNSLAEALVKAEGRGAIAAFSPSGLSIDGPAHVYHKALLAEIESGKHMRLGDAVLAAQAAYADSGAFPELLAIYHLFGDPAQKIR